MTSEYPTGLIRTTFVASPARGRVLAAKAVVLGAVAFAAGLVTGLAALFGSQPLARRNGFAPPAYATPSLADGPVLRAVVGTALVLALVAVLSLAVGALLRSTPLAVVVLVALVVVLPIVALLTSVEARQRVQRWAPMTAGPAVQASGDRDTPIGPWAGLGVLAGYAGAATAAGYAALRLRDAWAGRRRGFGGRRPARGRTVAGMSFLRTPAESPLYAGPASSLGYVPNYVKVFALAPDAYQAWLALGAAVRAGMPELRYELVTVTTARRLRSDYCTVAHAAILRDRFYGDETMRAVLADPEAAGLAPADLAAVRFADKVAGDPTAATEADVQALRDAGLSEEDIFQVVLAITIRRFFAGTLDATGAEPDPVYDPLADTVAR